MLEAVQEDLHDSDFLFAYLDDMNVATTPHRVEMCTSHWTRICFRIHGSKTNAIDDRPEFCDTLEVIARKSDPGAVQISPLRNRGSKSWGHHSVILSLRNPPQQKIVEHEILLERTPTVPDLQSAWSLQPRGDFRIDTMRDCGSVCVRFCMWRQVKAQKQNWQHPCH